MIDFANSYQGETCPVPVYVDDEGTAAKDAVLIKEGVLKSFLHNKESANHYRVAPAGNARAYAYSDEPLIRMRNTVILPGTSTLEDMIASVDDGYYLIRPGNARPVDQRIYVWDCLGWLRAKSAGRSRILSRGGLRCFKTVSMVSGEMGWMSGGMCGETADPRGHGWTG